jgi:hypothetical protein
MRRVGTLVTLPTQAELAGTAWVAGRQRVFSGSNASFM